MRGKALPPILAIAILSLIVLSSGAASAAPSDVFVLEFDDYTKEAEMGGKAVYGWEIYNNGNTPLFVDADVTSADAHWNTDASTATVTLYPGQSGIINITVTAPDTKDYPSVTTSLVLTFWDLSTRETWVAGYNATTTIAGGPIAPQTKIFGLFDNPLGGALMNPQYEVFMLNLIFTVVISLVLSFAFPKIKVLTKNTQTELDDMIIEIVAGPISALIVLHGTVLALESFVLPYAYYDMIAKAYNIILILMITWMGYKIFKDVVVVYAKKYAEKSDTELDDVLIPLLEKVGLIAIAVIGIVYVLSDFGIDLTLLIASMGVIGVVIGLAMQQTLGNLISGMFLLTDRPFKIGDTIKLENGDFCRVLEVGIRTTKLYKGATHDIIVVPNSDIANKMVVNVMQPDETALTSVKVGVAFGVDVEKVKAVLKEVALSHKMVMKDSEHSPLIRFTNFGDSSLEFTIFFWVDKVDSQWAAQSDLRESIAKAFAEKGIDIPFPQRVIRIEKADAELLRK